MSKLKLQAQGDFPFTFYIEKAIPTEQDGNLMVEGVASTINIDHDNERMAREALDSMCSIINDKTVPLRLEHSAKDSDVMGTVYKAWVDERNQLWVKAAISPDHASGKMIHNSMKNGIAKFGLSVGGRVKNAVRELSEQTGKYVKTFYDVILDEVSVTSKPANYDAWLVAKSIKTKTDDVEPFYKSSLYEQFLFENRSLDYMYQFAKSIPDKSWEKSESLEDNNTNNKMKEEDKKEKSEKEEEGTEKSFVTKSDFSKFADTVAKGFAGLTSIIKGMSTDAKDTTNPDKDKEDESTQQTAKGANGDDGKPVGDEPAMDATNPNKKKEENIGDKATKSADDEDEKKEKSEDEEKEKSFDDEDEKKEKSADDEDEKKEKSAEDDEEGEDKKKSAEDDEDKKEKSEKDDEDEKYGKGMSAAIKNINAISKKLTGAKVTKSEKVEKSSTGYSSIDDFAVAVSVALDNMNEKIEKSGYRVPGSQEAFMNEIRNNQELQKEIKTLLNIPGFKKSVSVGVPYAISKEGKKFALTASEVRSPATIKKSMEGKSFKDIYKANFSSFGEQNQ